MSSTVTEPPVVRTPQERPKRPPPRWTLWGGLLVVAAITVWAGDGIDFTIKPLFEDLTRGREIVKQFFQPNWSFVFDVRSAWLETIYIAVIAAVIGNGIALFAALLASKVTSPNRGAYQVFKTLLSVVRSLPDVAYGLLFVAAVGTGALGAVLALIMFNIGVNAKLTSETVDAVDRGPLEAADAGGANRIQRAWSAVLPQVMPNYVSYSLYVFEINIRASVVIGIVGGGGIGNVIQVQNAAGRYSNIGAIVAALFVVVFVLDRLSIWLRRRLV